MEDSEQGLFSREFLDTWHGNHCRLEAAPLLRLQRVFLPQRPEAFLQFFLKKRLA